MAGKVDVSLLLFSLLAIIAFVMNILYFSTAWAKANGKKVPKALDNLVSNYSWVYLLASVALLGYTGVELTTNVVNNV